MIHKSQNLFLVQDHQVKTFQKKVCTIKRKETKNPLENRVYNFFKSVIHFIILLYYYIILYYIIIYYNFFKSVIHFDQHRAVSKVLLKSAQKFLLKHLKPKISACGVMFALSTKVFAKTFKT